MSYFPHRLQPLAGEEELGHSHVFIRADCGRVELLVQDAQDLYESVLWVKAEWRTGYGFPENKIGEMYIGRDDGTEELLLNHFSHIRYDSFGSMEHTILSYTSSPASQQLRRPVEAPQPSSAATPCFLNSNPDLPSSFKTPSSQSVSSPTPFDPLLDQRPSRRSAAAPAVLHADIACG